MANKELQSSWSHLEANQHMGRVPKRGVGKFVSRQRYHVLSGTVGRDIARLDGQIAAISKEKRNIADY